VTIYYSDVLPLKAARGGRERGEEEEEEEQEQESMVKHKSADILCRVT